MASVATLSVLENSHVSPPPACVKDTSLLMSHFDIEFIVAAPVQYVLFYELPSLTKTEFLETIVPEIKHSLSITLQHFPPFAGNLIVYSTSIPKPEIRYVEGDSVKVTFAECTIDFNDLTGYDPRNCDKFYHLIPSLGDYAKISDHVKIPVCSLQVTLFPNCGFSLGVTTHHSLADASSLFCFLKAWASIAQCGTDESFLNSGTLPFYERVLDNPEREKLTREITRVDSLFDKEYQPPKLSGPSDKLRGSFVLTRTIIDRLKKLVLTHLPALPYVSSFTVTCAYIWSCFAKSCNEEDERQGFMIPVDGRRRLDPPIPESYIGNCAGRSTMTAKTTLLSGNEGFITAAKLIGEKLHKTLTNKDGILEDKSFEQEIKSQGWPQKVIVINGSPKFRFYDLDFGWGKPNKIEMISLDHFVHNMFLFMSVDSGKESNQDMEIGVCLAPNQMEIFASAFRKGLET